MSLDELTAIAGAADYTEDARTAARQVLEESGLAPPPRTVNEETPARASQPLPWRTTMLGLAIVSLCLLGIRFMVEQRRTAEINASLLEASQRWRQQVSPMQLDVALEHWIVFESNQDRSAFLEALSSASFAPAREGGNDEGSGRCARRIFACSPTRSLRG